MGGESAPSDRTSLGEVLSHVDALAVGNLDGAEGVVGAEFEAREGRTVRVRAGGEVVDHVRGVRHVAEGAAQAEAHAVVEVDELGAGELAGLVLEEEGQAAGSHGVRERNKGRSEGQKGGDRGIKRV